MACVTCIPWFSTFFRFFFWSRFWSLPGGFQASFGTFFASIFSSKILLISYLFLRPIFNWFLLIFGRMFQSKLCRVCLTFATWSNFKNLDFAWKVLQKWGLGALETLPESIQNHIENGTTTITDKLNQRPSKINRKLTQKYTYKSMKKSMFCLMRF